MAYTPNPQDPTQPADTVALNTAAAEFRALKQYILNALVPAGTIIDFAGPTAPAGYIQCTNTPNNVSRATYAALFAAIGTYWGQGDGTTTFSIPWFPPGFVAANTYGYLGLAGTTAGQVISHTHGVTDPGHSHSGAPAAGSNAYPGPYGYTVNATALTNTGVSTTGISVNAEGSTANYAAAIGVTKCVKY